MVKRWKVGAILGLVLLLMGVSVSASTAQSRPTPVIGREVAVARHLQDGEEFRISLPALLAQGHDLFAANWTSQEGGGRPLSKGTGAMLSDRDHPLTFPHNFNRISGPDANSCAGCHNAPYGIVGGGGDFVGNVFVLGQRFDFMTFDPGDHMLMKGSRNESGAAPTAQTFANNRATLGMFGSGYIEMLARQMTADLQALRDSTGPGQYKPLVTKGVSFGILGRHADGSWDTSRVEGLPAPSLLTTGPADPPNLIIRPFHQAGAVVSLRQFSINAFVQHHGIEAEERFGVDTDPDGDGFTNEMTRADVTAVSIYQATLAVPGRVIPNDPMIEQAVWQGEQLFDTIGCTACHLPTLPLDNYGWFFSEPNPYNPPGNLQPDGIGPVVVNLSDPRLPTPRLQPQNGVVLVPAFTDLKLHDITSGPDDPNAEPLDMNQPVGSPGFFAGNRYFLTRKLWGAANEPPYFHHGLFTTMREAVLAHAGEALTARQHFAQLSPHEQDTVIEFLKSLQVLPPGTKDLVVDETGHPKQWPP
ncbi:MAG: di-heme oxidoredictase family protein [Caldilineaceae bacterium]